MSTETSGKSIFEKIRDGKPPVSLRETIIGWRNVVLLPLFFFFALIGLIDIILGIVR